MTSVGQEREPHLPVGSEPVVGRSFRMHRVAVSRRLACGSSDQLWDMRHARWGCPRWWTAVTTQGVASCARCPSVVDPRPLTEPGDLGRPAAR